MGAPGGAARTDACKVLVISPLSQRETQVVIAHDPSGLLNRCPLSRSLEQDRIGVVDVSVNLSTVERRQLLETASTPRDRHMVHLAGSPSSYPRANELIVAPKRPIEQQHIGLGETIDERRREFATA